MARTYDPECYRLAEHFLAEPGDSDAERHALAVEIQQAVELWFWWREENKTKQKVPRAT